MNAETRRRELAGPPPTTAPTFHDWDVKEWGKSRFLFKDDMIQSHHLVIRKNGFCSRHFHTQKSNAFHILKGKLAVVIYGPQTATGQAFTTALLGPGESLVVDAMVSHRFHAVTQCEIIETYFPARVKHDDIIRFDKSGIIT